MVKGKLYKLANLDKNKRNNFLISYARGQKDKVGWLWTGNWADPTCTTFKDGAHFVSLGKKQIAADEDSHLGIDTWYEALGPDGNIHRLTPSMRSAYFRSP